MTTKTAVFMFFFGMLLTFGAVGGMENPEQADYLLEQLFVAIVGLGLMWAGTLGVQRGGSYDQR